jgi:hypothetical protein
VFSKVGQIILTGLIWLMCTFKTKIAKINEYFNSMHTQIRELQPTSKKVTKKKQKYNLN